MGVRDWILSFVPRPGPALVVEFDDEEVRCRRRDGTREAVRWDDLERVEILTSDQGPFVEDVFYVLHGGRTGCVVPQGAEGTAALLDRLQELPGFDNRAVIEAMGSTDNATFLCWRRPGAEPSEE